MMAAITNCKTKSIFNQRGSCDRRITKYRYFINCRGLIFACHQFNRSTMGVISLVNNLFKIHLKKYEAELGWHYQHPLELQKNTLADILKENRHVRFFADHLDHSLTLNEQLFRERIPVRTYDELMPYIQRIIAGEQNVLTAQKVKALAQTAGTTSGESKYIPVTRAHILSCQKGSWFTLTSLHLHREDMKIFARKNMLIGGGDYGNFPGTDMQLADISALMIQSIPRLLRGFYLPDVYTATMPNYEEKIRVIARIAAREPSLTMLGGVPTWNLALFRAVLAESGANHLLEVWPNLQAYVHGGVSFEPYRKHYEELIPAKDFLYHDIYNASEGYLGVQDQLDKDELLLLLNNGIYYEFIPFEAFRAGSRQTLTLGEVQTDVLYAMVLTNSSGLYRYLLGDVINFSSVHPYRFRVVGRTQEFINAFGEDLLLENVEQALLTVCAKYEVQIRDYTIAPYYMQVGEKGRHQWFVEFEEAPRDITAFAHTLDLEMQLINSNYAQKRSNDFAVDALELKVLPNGFFQQWLRDRGKVGGQSKVPKLANHRRFAENIISSLSSR